MKLDRYNATDRTTTSSIYSFKRRRSWRIRLITGLLSSNPNTRKLIAVKIRRKFPIKPKKDKKILTRFKRNPKY